MGEEDRSTFRIPSKSYLRYYFNCNCNGKQVLYSRSELNTSKYRFLVAGFYCISYCGNWVEATAWAKNMEKGEGFLPPPPLSPTSSFLFFALVSTFSTNSCENACYTRPRHVRLRRSRDRNSFLSVSFTFIFFFLPLRRVCLANRNIVQICRIFVFYHFKLVLFLLHHFLLAVFSVFESLHRAHSFRLVRTKWNVAYHLPFLGSFSVRDSRYNKVQHKFAPFFFHLPLCFRHPNRIFLSNGKHPGVSVTLPIMTSSTIGAHVMCSPSRFHFTNILG